MTPPRVLFYEKVEVKPDVAAKGFSAQNAYYFAKLSKIAYLPRDEVEGRIVGNAAGAGLGYDRFHWFQVSGGNQPTRSSPVS